MNARIAAMEQQVLTLMSSVFDAYSVVLFLPDGQAEDAECRLASYYSFGGDVQPETRVRPGQDLVGWILANQQPLAVSPLQEHGRLIYYGDGNDAGIKSFMGCPVLGGGVLCIDTQREEPFTAKEQEQLALFSSILSGVYSLNSQETKLGDMPRFFSKLGELDELRVHYRTWDSYIASFVSIVAQASRFDYVAFVNIEVPGESYAICAENQTVLVRNNEPFYQSIHSGLAGWVLRNGQPIVLTGEEGRVPALFGTSENLPEFAAAVVYPVFVNKSVLACLCLGHTKVHPVTETLKTFLKEAVGLLTVHAENLHLRMRLRRSMNTAQVYTKAPRKTVQDPAPAEPDSDQAK